jgi:enoyl-CoA hydratase/carnithine racemase
MEEAAVRTQVEDGQALLTIDRPAARNALSAQVLDGLLQALDQVEADPAVRVVVLTGAGDRAFCAGGDLSGLPEGGSLAGHALGRRYGTLLERLGACTRPTIARVNGHALAGGLGLVLACDLAVAVDSAELGTPEVDVGLFPMMVLAWLQRHVGRKRALQLLLTGDRLSAEDALRWGIVNRVVPRAELDEATQALVRRVSGKSRAILALGKAAFRSAEDLPLGQAMDFLAGQLSLNLRAEDAAEGVAAFQERRAPEWKDR